MWSEVPSLGTYTEGYWQPVVTVEAHKYDTCY